jgi:hypothetical protein
MHRIFLGTAVWIVAIFAAEFTVGVLVAHVGGPETRQALFTWHMLGGVFLATMVCVIHVMTMFHFIGSGKEIKEAVEVLGGDADVIKRLRVFKMRTSGMATLAPLVTGAAVILGGGAHQGVMPGWIHWGLALLALAVNLVAFPIEYRTLKANLDLIQEIDRRIKKEVSPVLFEQP